MTISRSVAYLDSSLVDIDEVTPRIGKLVDVMLDRLIWSYTPVGTDFVYRILQVLRGLG